MNKGLILFLCLIIAGLFELPASADEPCEYIGYNRTALAAELIDVRTALVGYLSGCSCFGKPDSCKNTQRGCMRLYYKMMCLSSALGASVRFSDQELEEYLNAYFVNTPAESARSVPNIDAASEKRASSYQ